MWLLPALIALLVAAVFIDWSTEAEAADSPDYWIDPEKERSAYLLSRSLGGPQ